MLSLPGDQRVSTVCRVAPSGLERARAPGASALSRKGRVTGIWGRRTTWDFPILLWSLASPLPGRGIRARVRPNPSRSRALTRWADAFGPSGRYPRPGVPSGPPGRSGSPDEDAMAEGIRRRGPPANPCPDRPDAAAC